MDYPHVKKLYYRVISSEETDYDKAASISDETYDFKWKLSKDQLAIEMKAHRNTEREAREIVEEYLKGWEVTAGLLHGPDSLSFRFSSSIILDRSSNDTYDRNTVLTVDPSETIVLSDEIKLHVSHGNFPDPPQNFKASPEVEMMFLRYKMYRDGRESLLNMAYWCLKVMEYTAGGRPEASDQYQIDQRVFRKLGELCSSRGDVYEARTLKGNAAIPPLKPVEREWIRAVVKRLILRVGEYAYDPVAKLPMITMSDF
jgi:hypothetical protein